MTPAELPGKSISAVWRRAFRRLRETAALMIGLPDYSRYVAHQRAHHPERPIMGRSEFVQERMARKYGGKGTGRCC